MATDKAWRPGWRRGYRYCGRRETPSTFSLLRSHVPATVFVWLIPHDDTKKRTHLQNPDRLHHLKLEYIPPVLWAFMCMHLRAFASFRGCPCVCRCFFILLKSSACIQIKAVFFFAHIVCIPFMNYLHGFLLYWMPRLICKKITSHFYQKTRRTQSPFFWFFRTPFFSLIVMVAAGSLFLARQRLDEYTDFHGMLRRDPLASIERLLPIPWMHFLQILK